MSFPGPPFDHELAEVLKLPMFSEPKEDWAIETIIKSRKEIEPQCSVQQIHDDPDITHEEFITLGPGGEIILSVLRSKTSTKEKDNPGIYQIHGGGMALGNRFYFISKMFPMIKELGAVVVSVEYRLAPEHSAPAAIEDSYAGLQWMFQNAGKLGVDASKIIVQGGSAGGGLAAGVALLNRDRKGPSLLAQLLIYPMLDDRCTSVSIKQFDTKGIWDGNTDRQAWDLYLPAGIRGTDKVSIYNAPSRAEDLSNLPQTFIEVGACEPFRDENVAYASKLWECGVQCELHVWPGAWHGYDVFVPTAQISLIAVKTRMDWLKRILVTTPAI